MTPDAEEGLRRPRLALWLIAKCTPEEYREAVLGDLEEALAKRSSGGRGALGAHLWCWRQLFNLDVWRLRSQVGRERLSVRGSAGPLDIAGVELRQAVRALRRNPGYASSALCTLVVGLGAATSIFSVLNGLFLRPIPGVESPDSLAVVQAREFGGALGVGSYMDYLDFAERSRSFTRMAAFKPRRADASSSGVPEPVEALMVTSSYFDVLGVSPRLGRFFEREVDRGDGAHPEVILTERLWRRWFGADPSALGRSITLNGMSYVVIGITPAPFRGTSLLGAPELFVPMTMQGHLMPSSGYLLDRRGWGGVSIVGRLGAGVSLAAASAEMGALGEELGVEYPNTNRDRSYSAADFRQAAIPGEMRGPIMGVGALLLGVVSMVWLVVCLNVANLFLARSLRRRREIAIRVAVGAGRGRVVGQLVGEFMLIALMAAIGGAAFAQLLAGVIASTPLPIALDVGMDGRTVLFVAILAVVSGLLCSLVPALSLASSKPRSVTTPARGPRPERRRWPSRVLIIGQVTGSVVLVFATGLFAQTLLHLTTVDRGFDSSHLLTARFAPTLQGYEAGGIADFYRRLTDEVGALPGVRAVALADGLPAASDFGSDSWFFQDAVEPERSTSLSSSAVSTNFFGVMGIPILAGRALAEREGPGRVPTVVVNEAAAALIEARTGRPAVGQGIGRNGPGGPFMEVVGVVGDSRSGRAAEARPFVYAAYGQLLELGLGGEQMVVLLKGTSDMTALAAPLREAAARVDPNVPAFDVMTMDRFLDRLVATERLTVAVLGASSTVALLLVAVGLYGLLAYLVTQRTREFGIRVALGAATGSLKRIIIREALTLSVTGLVLGGVVITVIMRWASGLLVGASPADPAAIALTVLAVLGVTLLAAHTPSARAARANPVVAIKAE